VTDANIISNNLGEGIKIVCYRVARKYLFDIIHCEKNIKYSDFKMTISVKPYFNGELFEMEDFCDPSSLTKNETWIGWDLDESTNPKIFDPLYTISHDIARNIMKQLDENDDVIANNPSPILTLEKVNDLYDLENELEVETKKLKPSKFSGFPPLVVTEQDVDDLNLVLKRFFIPRSKKILEDVFEKIAGYIQKYEHLSVKDKQEDRYYSDIYGLFHLVETETGKKSSMLRDQTIKDIITVNNIHTQNPYTFDCQGNYYKPFCEKDRDDIRTYNDMILWYTNRMYAIQNTIDYYNEKLK
jgi:hypothetical protein